MALLSWRILILLQLWWSKYSRRLPRSSRLWWEKVALQQKARTVGAIDRDVHHLVSGTSTEARRLTITGDPMADRPEAGQLFRVAMAHGKEP